MWNKIQARGMTQLHRPCRSAIFPSLPYRSVSYISAIETPPRMNQSWQYTRQGPPSETLEKHTGPIPTPQSEEIVVKVKAVSINPIDFKLAKFPTYIRRGMGAKPHGEPSVPCFDFAGIVHSVGNGAGEWTEGEEVFGRIVRSAASGSLQEYVAVSSATAMTRKPAGLSWEQAAAIPLVYMTAYGSFVDLGHLPFKPSAEERGKRSVLILGGSGGAGSQAIQLAKAMGLNVVTTCSASSNELVKKLGADETIDYRTENIGEKAKASKYAPFAVILDCVGGTEVIPYMDELLMEDPKHPELGIYVSIAGDMGPNEKMDFGPAIMHVGRQTLRTLRGSLNPYIPSWFPLRPWLANKRYQFYLSLPERRMMETVPAFLEHAGEVIIDQVFDFAHAREAFARSESGRAKGKVVIRVEE